MITRCVWRLRTELLLQLLHHFKNRTQDLARSFKALERPLRRHSRWGWTSLRICRKSQCLGPTICSSSHIIL